jgi:hypothetical protein
LKERDDGDRRNESDSARAFEGGRHALEHSVSRTALETRTAVFVEVTLCFGDRLC